MTATVLPLLLRPHALKPGDLVIAASLSGPLHAEYEPGIEPARVARERMVFGVRRAAPVVERGDTGGDRQGSTCFLRDAGVPVAAKAI